MDEFILENPDPGVTDTDDAQPAVHRLFSIAMLADLVGLPITTVRRLSRRGLIRPIKQIKQLMYFDFSEVAVARQLVQLLDSGKSITWIASNLAQLENWLEPGERSLAKRTVLFDGSQVLLRHGNALVEPGGQIRLDFDSLTTTEDPADGAESTVSIPFASLDSRPAEPNTPAQFREIADQFEEADEILGAIETYRALHLAFGPTAASCFRLAEWLYQTGQLEAASERYYMAIELDEDLVEARACLGCVLAELGQIDLAISAFRGALQVHPDYADVHFHLARGLENAGERQQAARHWRRFIELAPDSPWAQEARFHLDS